jgi:valyl-tRNA synthetase
MDSPLAGIAADWPEALIAAGWPEPREPEGWEDARVGDFGVIQDIVRAIRNLRSEKNIPLSKKLAAAIGGGARLALLKEQSPVIASLAGLDPAQLTILDSLQAKPEGAASLVVGAVEIHLPLAEAVDDAGEKARLEKELAEAQSQIERLENLLSSDFANRAPAAVVEKERGKLAVFRETAGKIRSQLQ